MASSQKLSFREELPSILGGLGAFGALHFGVWRWPRVRGLFGNDEQWFLLATVGLLGGLILLYVKVTGVRLLRARRARDAELGDIPDDDGPGE
ncbi:MAG: hypothetical protein ACYDCL_10815 [Myxococcales bacterium]